MDRRGGGKRWRPDNEARAASGGKPVRMATGGMFVILAIALLVAGCSKKEDNRSGFVEPAKAKASAQPGK
ncbi:hypothetical protein [Paenibacillus cymbidii]|uniref:hypothetical protein n=1 Tax=Paenibacillus cymbidii TaxID=1639034 RepID=UPI00108055E7|nr:hypothetical protein [Paenibacillus cymbidii]